MPTWRCPHCGTPQTETARCWVCRRSSTACVTCRHFRRSVAAGLGYCGLDRRRTPLDGGEIRACWEAARIVAGDDPPLDGTAPHAPLAADTTAATPAMPRRDFVEIETTAPGAMTETAPTTPLTVETPATWPLPPSPGWSFWSDLEG